MFIRQLNGLSLGRKRRRIWTVNYSQCCSAYTRTRRTRQLTGGPPREIRHKQSRALLARYIRPLIGTQEDREECQLTKKITTCNDQVTFVQPIISESSIRMFSTFFLYTPSCDATIPLVTLTSYPIRHIALCFFLYNAYIHIVCKTCHHEERLGNCSKFAFGGFADQKDR